MYSKESVFSMIVLLFFFISDTYSFQVERNQTGDIILDAKTADVCLRINRTEWKNNACRCKQDFTTFHAPTRNIFGCMSREEISSKINFTFSSFTDHQSLNDNPSASVTLFV